MKKVLLLILTLGGTYCAYAQICGTPSPVNPTIYSSTANTKRANTSLCINVYFHIVRNTNGTNAFTPPNTDKIINKLNTFYSTHNITFKNAGSEFIDNSDLLIIDARNSVKEENVLFSTQSRSGAINFYIVDRFVRAGLVGKAQSIPSRNLVMRDTDVLTSVSAHELGHCLGLLHTFRGSPAEDTPGSCLEYIISSSPNCNNCGDMVCDTSADANKKNLNGYNPDLTNIMSYYLPADHLTNGQANRIQRTLASSSLLQSIIRPTLSTIKKICSGSTASVSVSSLGDLTTTWTTSPNVSVTSSNNSSATIRATGSNSPRAWVKATLSSGIVLTENFYIKSLPTIEFANTSLTEALFNPSTTTMVDYAAVTIRDGDRIPVTITGSFAWKNTRRSSLPWLGRDGHGNNPGIREYFDPASIRSALAVPYSRCYISRPANSLAGTYIPENPLEEIFGISLANNLAGTYTLVDHYFVEPPSQAADYRRSPPIQIRGSGLVEVQLSARNECGCVTKVNHYLAKPSTSSTAFTSSVRIWPNPASTQLNIRVTMPEPPSGDDVVAGHMSLAALSACCRAADSNPRYPQPSCCIERNSYTDLPRPRREGISVTQSYTYVLSVNSLRDGNSHQSIPHSQRFTLATTVGNSVSRTINLDTSSWPRGLYVVKIVSNNESNSYVRHTVIITN